MYTSLAQAPDFPAELVEDDPGGFLRETWENFRGLSTRIIDLQHRAAVVAATAKALGDLQLHQEARTSVEALARLQQIHHAAVTQIEKSAGWLGLGSHHAGLGAIPLAPAVLAGLAILVAWVFRHYAAQERLIDAMEAGEISAEELEALNRLGPAPTAVLSGFADVGKIILWGALAWFALQAFQGWRSNPELRTFMANPPHQIGRDVYRVQYRHEEDGRDYQHDFGGGVEMWGDDDGSVVLTHRRGRPLWREF